MQASRRNPDVYTLAFKEKGQNNSDDLRYQLEAAEEELDEDVMKRMIPLNF